MRSIAVNRGQSRSIAVWTPPKGGKASAVANAMADGETCKIGPDGQFLPIKGDPSKAVSGGRKCGEIPVRTSRIPPNTGGGYPQKKAES